MNLETKNSLSKNYIYNLIYQVLVVIIPLILIPYISRTLQPTNVGVYSFAHSITMYFSQFALLGVNLYGTKIISTKRNKPNELKKNFWEIFVVKGIVAITIILLFYTFFTFLYDLPLFSVDGNLIFEHPEIYYILGIILFSNFIDITYLYTGTEKFSSIVIRNSMIKILTLIFVFVFVRKPEDLWVYALIMASGELIGQAILWFGLMKTPLFIKDEKIEGFHPFSHLKGLFTLFLPQAIILLYTSLNVVMIGILSNEQEVAFFDMSSKIINTVLVIATALGTVVVPRISALFEENDFEKIKDILKKAIQISTYLSFPMMFGLIALSYEFVPWFFGNEFEPAIIVLSLYTIKVVFVTITNVIGIQYLIPTNQNKKFTYSVLVGAVINLILNIIFIKNYGAVGAVIGSLISEFGVLIYQLISTKNEIPFAKYIMQTYKSLLSALVMFGVVYFVKISTYDTLLHFIMNILKHDFISGFITLALYAVLGIVVYVITSQLLKNSIQKIIITRSFDKIRGIFHKND